MCIGKSRSDCSPEDIARIHRFQLQLQLVSGWLTISDDMIRHEVETCAVRHGIDLSELFVIVPTSSAAAAMECEGICSQWTRRPEVSQWRSFLEVNALKRCEFKKETNQCTKGSYKNSMHDGIVDGQPVHLIPLQYICEGIFSHARDMVPYDKLCRFVRFIIFINVFLNLFLNRHELLSSTWSIVFYISSSYMLVIWYFPIAMFMASAVGDMYRQYCVSQLLEDMLRVSNVRKDIHPGKTSVKNKKRIKERGGKPIRKRQGKHHGSALLKPLRDSTSTIGGSDISNEDVDSEYFQTTILDPSPPMLGSPSYKVLARSTSGNELMAYSDFPIPAVDVTYPQNLVNWCNCRIVLSNMGTRFKLRINIYTGE